VQDRLQCTERMAGKGCVSARGAQVTPRPLAVPVPAIAAVTHPVSGGGNIAPAGAPPAPAAQTAFPDPPRPRPGMTPKNTICLWFDGTALDAANFYAQTFPDSEVRAVHRAPADYPSGSAGDVLTVEFTVIGIACLGLNGGPAFPQTEAFSFQVATDDQAETDRLWD